MTNWNEQQKFIELEERNLYNRVRRARFEAACAKLEATICGLQNDRAGYNNAKQHELIHNDRAERLYAEWKDLLARIKEGDRNERLAAQRNQTA